MRVGRGVEITFERMEQILRAIDPSLVDEGIHLAEVDFVPEVHANVIFFGFIGDMDDTPEHASVLVSGTPIPVVRWDSDGQSG